MKDKTKKNNAFGKIINIFAWLSFVLATFMALVTVFASFSGEQNGKEIFGYKLLIVSSDSMSLSPLSEDESVYFNVGDVIIIKTVEDGQVFSEGDVITFVSYDKDSYGKTITHKIREVRYNDLGDLVGYVTYGINTGVNDQTIVVPNSIVGVYSSKISKIGKIFSFMKTPRGYFISILTPCVLLIIFFSMKVGNAVGSRKVMVEYDKELEKLEKRVEELEKIVSKTPNKVTENVPIEETKPPQVEIIPPQVETTPTIVVEEIATTTSVEEYRAVVETETQVGTRLVINGTKSSFAKKVLYLDKEIQEYFNLLHNELTIYKKIKARLSYKCMSYRVGRKLLAKISVRGKTLTAHFALDVNAFDYNVYHQKDMGSVKAFELVPFTVKVKSDRGAGKALRLIGELASLNELTKLENFQRVNVLDLLKEFNSEGVNVEPAEVVEEKDKLIINGKKISFAEKILSLDKTTKNYFNDLHNELCSYKKVSSRLSQKCMSYRTGRKLLAKISVRGKTLNLYLNLDPNEFNKNVYFQKDVGDIKSYMGVPFRVKVKSERGKNNAIKLINNLGDKNDLVKNEKYTRISVISLLAPSINEITLGDLSKKDKLIINGKKVCFTEKLERLTEDVKKFYQEIREELTSYKKVSERLSNKCMSYRTGRKLLAKISVRGKTLTLYFALNVNDFNKNVYFQKDASNVKAYKDVPFSVRVKSNRAKNNAIKLIKDLMNENQVEKNKK